jgi:hypothetical protein
MTFEQALKAMKEGKAVTVGDYAGYFRYDGSLIWRYSSETKELSQERLMPVEYILSDKWEIVENIVPLSIPTKSDYDYGYEEGYTAGYNAGKNAVETEFYFEIKEMCDNEISKILNK